MAAGPEHGRRHRRHAALPAAALGEVPRHAAQHHVVDQRVHVVEAPPPHHGQRGRVRGGPLVPVHFSGDGREMLFSTTALNISRYADVGLLPASLLLRPPLPAPLPAPESVLMRPSPAVPFSRLGLLRVLMLPLCRITLAVAAVVAAAVSAIRRRGERGRGPAVQAAREGRRGGGLVRAMQAEQGGRPSAKRLQRLAMLTYSQQPWVQQVLLAAANGTPPNPGTRAARPRARRRSRPRAASRWGSAAPVTALGAHGAAPPSRRPRT